MSVLSWLKPATLAVTVVAAGSMLAPAPVQAQVTVLRGSPSQPLLPPVPDNTQDNQSSSYSPDSYADDYPYYGDDFPFGGGVGRRFSHEGGFSHRGFNAGFHRGGFHGGGFHGGGFHGGGFHGGGFHGGGGHR